MGLAQHLHEREARTANRLPASAAVHVPFMRHETDLFNPQKPRLPMAAILHDVVFLIDVDNTLLDNDRIIADLRDHLMQEFGVACSGRYWTLFEELRDG